ncbi:MAG: 4-hydroxy-tetrahydrodipicolinate reductase [Caulobacteraceae bacterium]|jgi:4-hydroxy-tetrahydrodipicolinate reductase
MESANRLNLGVAGAKGRMGVAVISLIAERGDLSLAAAFDQPDSAEVEFAFRTCEVIVDFSAPAGSTALARAAAARGGPALVIGTTGFSADEEAAIAEAAGAIAIVKSGNFSLGVSVLAALVEEAARRLSAEGWDLEIMEAHHRRKVDAPSGTALLLGEAAARGRGVDLASVSERGRDGLTGPRSHGAIGFVSLRAGGLVGEHSVILASDDEVLTLSHSARDRKLFARGALTAALWVRGRPPGLYDMRDVLGLS